MINVKYRAGDKYWLVNGKLHRIDGPAIEYAYGSKTWYLKGKLHRLDGPAVEEINGAKQWWIQNFYINSVSFFIQKFF